MIYVDPLFDWPADAVANAQARRLTEKHGQWCHMTADTEQELLVFGIQIGLRSSWLQHQGRHDVHFDLVPSRRARAVRMGAVQVSAKEFNEILRAKREGRPIPVFNREEPRQPAEQQPKLL